MATKSSEPRISRFHKGEIVTVHRSQIKGAPYNPRRLSEQQAKTLRKSIRRHGLLGLPVWNASTGHIVSGHQRIGQLDALERSEDYLLQVQSVTLSERDERAANVALNNTNAQGEFDLDALGAMLADQDERDELAEAMLLTDADLALIASESAEFDRLFSRSSATTEDDAAAIAAIKDRKKEYKDDDREANNAEFILVVVFRDRADVDAFLAERGLLPEQRYIAGDMLRAWLRKKNPGRQAGV